MLYLKFCNLRVASQGYLLASFLFLGIVFALPVALGSAALALDLPFSSDEALGGLVFPGTAYVLIGKAGTANFHRQRNQLLTVRLRSYGASMGFSHGVVKAVAPLLISAFLEHVSEHLPGPSLTFILAIHL